MAALPPSDLDQVVRAMRVEASSPLAACVSASEMESLVPGIGLHSWLRYAKGGGVAAEAGASYAAVDNGSPSISPLHPAAVAKAGSPLVSNRKLKQHPQAGVSEEILPENCAGLHIPFGIVLHVEMYLQNLWRACQVVLRLTTG